MGISGWGYAKIAVFRRQGYKATIYLEQIELQISSIKQ